MEIVGVEKIAFQALREQFSDGSFPRTGNSHYEN
jgi:hypothetical protein